MKHFLLLAVCLAAVFLGACSTESQFPVATGEASVRAINTIPTSPSFSFLIQERLIGAVEYKTASEPARYDDIDYTFSFEVLLPGDPPRITRVASQVLAVEADRDYTFVISGPIAAPVITVWEGDDRAWDGSETVFETRVGHTAASLGDVDVYFDAATTPPTLGPVLGTLAFGEVLPAADFETGDYILTITAAGDPTNVHFESAPVNISARISAIISVFEGDANDLSPWSVRLFNQNAGGAGVLVDPRFLPTLRLFHASMDFGAADVYFDDPLTAPVLEDHAFGDITDDLDVPAGTLPLTYTTADNIGSILIDAERAIPAIARTHLYVVRNSLGDDVLVDHFPDRRSIETRARLSIIHTATSHAAVDIYFVPRVLPIDETRELSEDALPLIRGLALSSDPRQFPMVAGSFDIFVTVLGDKTVLAGPIPLDTSLGDVIDMIIYENVDPNVVDLAFIPVP